MFRFVMAVVAVVSGGLGIYEFAGRGEREAQMQAQLRRTIRNEFARTLGTAREAETRSRAVHGAASAAMERTAEVRRTAELFRRGLTPVSALDAVQAPQIEALLRQRDELARRGDVLESSSRQLAEAMADLGRLKARLGGDAVRTRSLDDELERMQTLMSSMEDQHAQTRAQRRTLESEIQAVQRTIDRNIDMSFQTFE